MREISWTEGLAVRDGCTLSRSRAAKPARQEEELAPAPWRGVPSDGPPTGTAAIRLCGLEEEAQNELPSHILFKFPLLIGVGLAAGKPFSSHRCQQQKVSELK